MLSRFSLRTASRTTRSRIITNYIPVQPRLLASWSIAQTTTASARRPYSSTPMAAPTDTQATEVRNDTGITPDSISQTLKEKLQADHVQVEDISGGCGQSFTALIVSSQFYGKPLLARHRLVNAALKEEIAAIHAWTPRCLTPLQWDRQVQKEKLAGEASGDLE